MRFWLSFSVLLVISACRESASPTSTDSNVKSPLGEIGGLLTKEQASDKEPIVPKSNEPESAPLIPIAQHVPDKPGYVISPYNGKWIDVTGVPPGKLMIDPHYRDDESKLFRVPDVTPPAPPEAPSDLEGEESV